LLRQDWLKNIIAHLFFLPQLMALQKGSARSINGFNIYEALQKM